MDESKRLDLLRRLQKAKQVPERQCAVGIYVGERTFADGRIIRGVFGMADIMGACANPVTARCQLMLDGRLRDYYWWACDNPEHRLDAGIIQHVDADGKVIRVEHILPLPPADERPQLPEPKKKRRRKKDG